jgi:ribosomal protein L7/L12
MIYRFIENGEKVQAFGEDEFDAATNFVKSRTLGELLAEPSIVLTSETHTYKFEIDFGATATEGVDDDSSVVSPPVVVERNGNKLWVRQHPRAHQSRKIAAIKVLRELTCLGLKETKAMVEQRDWTRVEFRTDAADVEWFSAEALCAQLEATCFVQMAWRGDE